MLLLCFSFAIRNILQILLKIFLIQSLHIVEKKNFVNKHKKKMCYKENKLLFCWGCGKWPDFSSQSFYFQYDHRFLFSREIRSIRKIRQQKRIKFGLPGYIWVVIYQDAYKRKIIWEEFLLPIFCKIFWWKRQTCVLKTFEFLTLHFSIF